MKIVYRKYTMKSRPPLETVFRRVSSDVLSAAEDGPLCHKKHPARRLPAWLSDFERPSLDNTLNARISFIDMKNRWIKILALVLIACLSALAADACACPDGEAEDVACVCCGAGHPAYLVAGFSSLDVRYKVSSLIIVFTVPECRFLEPPFRPPSVV
jgi:hypothetical protein